MLGVEGRLAGAAHEGRKQMTPIERRIGDGVVRVVSMGLLVDDEETALMWRGLMLNRGVQHFLQDVRWGDDLDYLLVDMPPGTGDVQMGVAKLHPPRRGHRGHDAGPGRPEGRRPRRGHGPQELPAGGRRHREHERLRTATTARRTRCSARAAGEQLATDAGVPLLGEIPLEPAVSAGGDDGTPVALGDGPAAEAFRAIADHIVEEAVPLTAMAGCSARMLDAAVAALDARDADSADVPDPTSTPVPAPSPR